MLPAVCEYAICIPNLASYSLSNTKATKPMNSPLLKQSIILFRPHLNSQKTLTYI